MGEDEGEEEEQGGIPETTSTQQSSTISLTASKKYSSFDIDSYIPYDGNDTTEEIIATTKTAAAVNENINNNPVKIKMDDNNASPTKESNTFSFYSSTDIKEEDINDNGSNNIHVVDCIPNNDNEVIVLEKENSSLSEEDEDDTDESSGEFTEETVSDDEEEED